ncbi:MAG: 50S ribosomal protein L18 [Gammaproteobacteria bacterium]
MKSSKKQVRTRRGLRIRAKIRELNAVKLTIHRTPRHIYAQVIEQKDGADHVVVTASTVEPEVRKKLEATGNKAAAEMIGQLVAERAVKAGVKQVAFDRSGFKYHGRVQVLADAARAGGLEF